MRYLIYFTGILIAAIFFVQSKTSYEHRVALLSSNLIITNEVDSLNNTLNKLNAFKVYKPQTLLGSYQDFLNNIYLIANANGAVVLTKSDSLSSDKDIKNSVKESDYKGVNKIDLDVTVGNLTNFNKLSAIFIALADLEESTPIIIRGFFQEKDYVIFNVSILGV